MRFQRKELDREVKRRDKRMARDKVVDRAEVDDEGCRCLKFKCQMSVSGFVFNESTQSAGSP